MLGVIVIEECDLIKLLSTRALNKWYGNGIRGYLSDDLREKYSREFWEARKKFLDEFWNNNNVCKGSTWHSNKTCWLDNGKWIYVDGAKMVHVATRSGKEIHYNWETMFYDKFIRDYIILDEEKDKLDKTRKSYKGLYIILCCKELGIFVFAAKEFKERVMEKGKISAYGYIHWNVFPTNGGKEIWLIISSGDRINITDRRNNLGLLR